MESEQRSTTKQLSDAGRHPSRLDSSDADDSRVIAINVNKPLLRNDMHDEQSVAAQPGMATGRISRTLVNFWLDALLATVFVKLCITAVIVQFVFPPGIAARGVSLWGMSYGQWCSIQFSLLAVLALGVLVHVMLHWTWVCGVLTKRILGQHRIPDNGIRTIYGVGLFICLLLIGAAAVGLAQWMIISPD